MNKYITANKHEYYAIDTTSIVLIPVNHFVMGVSADCSKYGVTAEAMVGYQWGRMEGLAVAGLGTRPQIGQNGTTISPNFGIGLRYLPLGIIDTNWQPYVGVEAGGQFFRAVGEGMKSQGYTPYIELATGCQYDLGKKRPFTVGVDLSFGYANIKSKANSLFGSGKPYLNPGYYIKAGVSFFFNAPNKPVEKYHKAQVGSLTQKELKKKSL